MSIYIIVSSKKNSKVVDSYKKIEPNYLVLATTEWNKETNSFIDSISSDRIEL